MIKIVLCALNEAQDLKKLIPDLTYELKRIDSDFEIIISIDGSSDDSFAILSEFQKSNPIKILEPLNIRGLGSACNRVYSAAISDSKDDDIVIYMDSDNTHSPAQIKDMLDLLNSKELDVVVASRFCDKSTMESFPPHRKLISTIASILLSNLVGFRNISGNKLMDYTSGYRAYRAKKLKELYEIYGDKLISEPDFTSTCEIILKLGSLSAKIDEIPLIYDYGQKVGKSKLRIFSNSYQLFTLLSNFFFTNKIKKLSK